MMTDQRPRGLSKNLEYYSQVNILGSWFKSVNLSALVMRGEQDISEQNYRVASLMRNRPPIGPLSRPMPRELW